MTKGRVALQGRVDARRKVFFIPVGAPHAHDLSCWDLQDSGIAIADILRFQASHSLLFFQFEVKV
jgi:hypothetical protein